MLIKFSRKIMAINLILFPIKQMFVQKVTLNYSFSNYGMHLFNQHWYVPRNASTLVNVVTWPVIPDMTLPVQVTCVPVKWAAVVADMDTQVILKDDLFISLVYCFRTK